MFDVFMKWLFAIIVMGLTSIAPIHSVMLTVGILIFFDLITGIMASLRKKQKVSSSAMRRTVSKMVIYQIAVISGFVVEVHMLNGIFPVTKVISAAIGLVELTSILENCNTISGENIFRNLIKWLGSKNDNIWK